MAQQSMFLVSSYTGQYVVCRDLPLILPTECPICNKLFGDSIIPITSVCNLDFSCEGKDLVPVKSVAEFAFSHSAVSNSDRVGSSVDIFDDVHHCDVVSVYRCVNCGSLFAVKYSVTSNDAALVDISEDESFDVTCSILGQFPDCHEGTLFSSFVVSSFSKFVDLYHQAEKAEFSGLTDICGMGYRKALEYLVSTYIRCNTDVLPNDFDAMPLSKKIKQFISNDDIKTLAERAAWLGNDNTHIEQKHSDYSVEDMKQFILAIVSYIDFKQCVKKASEIQRK